MKLHTQIHSRMWLGGTMSEIALERDSDAFKLAIYLITSPHSHMSGVYYCPVTEMSRHTGMDAETVKKYLAELEDEGFCRYDERTQIVWVITMLRWQIGENLKQNDHRVKNVLNHLRALPQNPFTAGFLEHHKGLTKGLVQGAYEGAPSLPIPSCPFPGGRGEGLDLAGKGLAQGASEKADVRK